MNCANCGKPLLAGSTICPVCGADNALLTQTPVTPGVISSPSPASASNGVSDTNAQVLETLPPKENITEVQTLESKIPSSPDELIQEQVQSDQTSVENTKNFETLDDGFVELEDEEKATITENMAPPSLNVEEENLTLGAGDLTNEASVSTYSKEAEQEQLKEEQEEQTRQEERVDIAIPSVQSTVEVALPTDGSAPEMTQDNNTAGDIGVSTPTNLESPNKTNKFKISIPKGSKNVPKALMIIVAVIFLIVGVLLGKIFFSKNYCSSSTNRSVLSNTKVKYVSDGKNNITNINGYTYKIPEQYTYDKDNGGLLVYSETGLFLLFIKTENGVYSDLSGAKNSIRETLRDNSYTVSSVKELKANDVEFLVFETTTKMVNRMLAFATASDTEVFYLEIVTTNNTFDYDVLDVAADILKNASPGDKNTEMESISISDASKVSIKAAEEYSNLVKR